MGLTSVSDCIPSLTDRLTIDKDWFVFMKFYNNKFYFYYFWL